MGARIEAESSVLLALASERRAIASRSRERAAAKTPANWLRRALGNAKRRAIKKEVPFSLTATDIVLPEYCPVLGIPFVFGRQDDANPSIDRIRPERGYTPDNIVVISCRANRIKNDASVYELEKVIAYLRPLVENGSSEGP